MFTNMIESVETVRVSNAVAAGTTLITSSAVDCHDCDGVHFEVLFGSITSTAVTSIKAQQANDSGGSPDDFTDLAGSAVAVADTQSNKVGVLDVCKPGKRYVKCLVVRGTANAVVDGIIAHKYKLRKSPAVQGSTVVATSKVITTPAEGTA